MTVLITFIGVDFLRIIDAVRYWHKRVPIERIYLVYDKKGDIFGQISRRNLTDLSKVLSFALKEPLKVGVNPRSFEEVFSTLYVLARKEVNHGSDVLIDATSTTREAYGAVLLISYLVPRVRVFITPPKLREWYLPKPGTPSFEEWFFKARNIRGGEPIEIPSPTSKREIVNSEEAKLLITLFDHDGFASSIKNLIIWCKENPKDPVVKNKFSRLVKRLLDKGLIVCIPGSKVKSVSLTNFGRVLARALKLYRSNAWNRKDHISALSESAYSSFYLEEEESSPA